MTSEADKKIRSLENLDKFGGFNLAASWVKESAVSASKAEHFGT